LSDADSGDKMEVQWAGGESLTDLRKSFDLFRREILYNIIIEFSITVKGVWMTKMYLNGTYTKVNIYLMFSNSELFRTA
jgi:hypothetical protein